MAVVFGWVLHNLHSAVIDFLSQTFVSSGGSGIVQFGVRIVVQAPRMRGFRFSP
jgi:hypothetical protein